MSATQTLILGDCLDVFKNLPFKLQAIVADPPAGIGFMGRKWDKHSPEASYNPPIAPRSKKHLRELQERHAFILYWAARFAAAYDACEDDATALIWALPRTSDWTAEALRLAGWAIVDVITHHFGSGWPKGPSLLKPGSEHWILARKGELNIDVNACRIERGESTARTDNGAPGYRRPHGKPGINGGHKGGAWPANVLLSHAESCVCVGEAPVCECGAPGWWACPVAEMDAQSGQRGEGGASRFFTRFGYYGKAPSGEKHAGCEGLYWRRNDKAAFGFDRIEKAEWERLPGDAVVGTSSGQDNREGRQQKGERAWGNVHPTVKRLSLMRWLHRLTGVQRIGDMCAGSGSGMIAALMDGIDWVGAETCPHALEIAQARYAFWSRLTPAMVAEYTETEIVPVPPKINAGQLGLF